VNNVIQELLYADGHGHPLLKKAGIKFIVENTEKVLASDSFKLIHKFEFLTKEFIMATVSKK
jgi:hypothetical protein